MTCSVLILNYNGRRHLEQCLPSLVVAAGKLAGECPIVVVDNRSTDDSMAWLREHYSNVETVIAKRNDYLFTLNDVVASRKEDFVVILNNDMRFDENFIRAMLPHFNDPDVFAVTARVMDWDGKQVTTGQRIGRIQRFWFYKSWRFEMDHPCLTLDAGGGYAAFRRKMFVDLGGFDELYRPGYYEDTDLSFRAWQRGWKVIYEPGSIVFHKESASMLERFGSRGQARLVCRNHLLFTAKNVGGWGFLLGFLLLLPIRAIRPLFRGDMLPLQAFLAALPRLPSAIYARLRERRHGRFSNEFLRNFAQDARPLDPVAPKISC